MTRHVQESLAQRRQILLLPRHNMQNCQYLMVYRPIHCPFFMQTPPQALEWSYRAPLLIEEILSCEPDVICLQEVNHYGEHEGRVI